MDEKRIADSLVMKLASKGITVEWALDYTEKQFKKYARVYEFSRIYAQSGTGGDGVHCDIGSGQYTIWFEQEGNEVAIETTTFGEGAPEIDKVWYDVLDEMVVDSPNDFKQLFKKFLDKLSEAEDEARLRWEEEEGIDRDAKSASKRTAKAKFKEGDQVKIGNGRKIWVVKRVNEQNWGTTYDLQDINGRKGATGVTEDSILGLGERELDKKGRDAYQAATDEFKKGGWVVIDFARTTSQMLGQVLKITKSGRIQVQQYHGGSWDDGDRNTERFMPDKSNKGDKMNFSPSLLMREWKWWSGRGTGMQYIKPYKGGPLTVLLD